MFDGKGRPEEWKTRVAVPIFKGKGDVMGCGAYRGVKPLEHAMEIVERVLENRMRGLVTIDDMQFGFMRWKGTTNALFILRRMQEEFRGREKKLYMCFVDLKKAFNRIPRKVMEWGLRKKGLEEALVQAVMSLYEGSRTKVRVGSGISEEFGVRVGVHQIYVLSPLIFTIVVGDVTEQVREGLLNEILYADDLVLMRETLNDIKRINNPFPTYSTRIYFAQNDFSFRSAHHHLSFSNIHFQSLVFQCTSPFLEPLPYIIQSFTHHQIIRVQNSIQ